MNTFFDALSSRQLVFVTGKGGVGKTVFAAALAQRAVKAGRRVLLVEASSVGQLASLFGIADAPLHREVAVTKRLSLINLDPPQCFREYVVKYLGQKGLFDRVFSHQLVHTFINTVPGFAELMMLGRLLYSCELAPAPRPDLVIFDCYASGHFLSLMTTPDAVLGANFGGPLTRETERVKAFLQDPAKCGVVYLAAAEPLVISEALEFLPRLAAKSPAALAGVVINRLPASLMAADRDFVEVAPGSDAASAPTLTDLAPSGAKLGGDVASFGSAWPLAANVMAARLMLAKRALNELAQGYADATRSQPHLPTFLLPDLGAIAEPWSDDFGAGLLAAAKRLEVRRGQ